MTTSPQSKYVKVDVSPARIARVWAGVSGRLDAAPRRQRRWLRRGVAGAALAAVTLVAALHLVNERHARSAWQRALLETAGDTLAVALDDGSRLELAAQTKLRVTGNEPLALSLELEHGRVDCDITPRPGRHFSVYAAGVEVRVKGTRFGVELAPARDRVAVDVSRGLVEVSWNHGAEHRDLGAGEHWSVELAPSSAAKGTRGAEPPSTAAASATASETPSASPAAEAPTPDASSAHAATARAGSSIPGARELLDLGNAARRAGDVAGATHAYEELLRSHPADPRAGLAAFELGRLRMDRLGDVPGAISALQKAVALAPGAGLREDAMARLVDAYAAAGSRERCRSAQAAYLKSFPSGVHATAVARQCASR